MTFWAELTQGWEGRLGLPYAMLAVVVSAFALMLIAIVGLAVNLCGWRRAR